MTPPDSSAASAPSTPAAATSTASPTPTTGPAAAPWRWAPTAHAPATPTTRPASSCARYRTGPNAANATFTYDPAGNRTLLLDSGPRTTSTYDAANQLLLDLALAGRTSYAYDSAGNRSRKDDPGAAAPAPAWDAHNRLTQAEPVAGPVTMAYDGDGRRNRKQTTTQTRLFVYDFKKVLQDTDDAGVTQKQYLNTEDQYGNLVGAPTAAPPASSLRRPRLRRHILAPDGGAPDRYAYRAFGLETHTPGSDDNHYTWVGKQGYIQAWRSASTS